MLNNNSETPKSAQYYVQMLLLKTSNNKEVAKLIFTKCFNELPENLKRLNTAIANKHYKAAFDIIHMMRGTFATCGFTELFEQYNTLETELNKQPSANIQQELNNLKFVIDDLMAKQEDIVKLLQI